jgi:hypothetical protein
MRLPHHLRLDCRAHLTRLQSLTGLRLDGLARTPVSEGDYRAGPSTRPGVPAGMLAAAGASGDQGGNPDAHEARLALQSHPEADSSAVPQPARQWLSQEICSLLASAVRSMPALCQVGHVGVFGP